MNKRNSTLHQNFSLMFWIKALTEVKVINVVSTLFFIHRGLTLSNIFFTAVIYSLITIIAEIPSSYLADKIGRKKIIILSIIFSLCYWILNIYANNFLQFTFAFVILSFSAALMSGTDEALVYDTSRELGDESRTLKKLGLFYSAQRIFKVIVPIIAVLIAKNLTDQEFILILSIDVIANLTALILSLFLVEPKRYINLEIIEAGVLRDALRLFTRNKQLLKLMLNKSILFIAIFILWRISSDFFVSIGVSILAFGFITALYQFIIYYYSSRIDAMFPMISPAQKIKWLDILSTFFLGVFLINYLTINNRILFIICFGLSIALETIRWPIFSELINKLSNSYNRATTLSLNNFLKSILDIPLLFFSSYLISINYTYLFFFVFGLSLIPTIFIPVGAKDSE